MRNKIEGVTAVVGGQYGSEGKGVIVNHLADRFDIHVRTGAPNAGHSFYHGDNVIKMQTIPCGWTNTDALLFIGAGGLVNPKIFMEEAIMLHKIDKHILDKVFIDGSCGVLDEEFHNAEGGINGEMHKRIGSTGEGVGPARVARINRDPERFRLARDIEIGEFYDHRTKIDMSSFTMEGTAVRMNMMLDEGKNIMLEGTQGSGLSLIHGPWPYCTSTDTNAAQLCADAGISPLRVGNVILVLRTYPIRVAGNSGPLSNELTWDEMSQRVGRPLIEKTTVTQKIRRVGMFDWDMAQQAVTLNQPTSIALTFMDYIEPESAGVTEWRDFGTKARAFIHDVERNLGVPVNFVSTGGPRWAVAEIGGIL